MSSPLFNYLYEMLSERGVNVTIVPFMPLSRDAIRKCVVHDIKNRFPDIQSSDVVATSRQITEQILQELKFFNDDYPVFSTSGCKKVSSKLDMILEGVNYSNMGGLIPDGL